MGVYRYACPRPTGLQPPVDQVFGEGLVAIEKDVLSRAGPRISRNARSAATVAVVRRRCGRASPLPRRTVSLRPFRSRSSSAGLPPRHAAARPARAGRSRRGPRARRGGGRRCPPARPCLPGRHAGRAPARRSGTWARYRALSGSAAAARRAGRGYPVPGGIP